MGEPALDISLARAFLDGTNDALLVIGPDRRVLEISKPFLELWQISREAILNREIDAVLELTARNFSDPQAYVQQSLARLNESASVVDELHCQDGRRLERIITTCDATNWQLWRFREVFSPLLGEQAQAKYLLSAIIDSSNDAIISKDLESRVTTWNMGAERLFGYTAAEAIGQPITILFPPELIDEEVTILSRIRKGERIEHYQTERLRKDGKRIPISITVSPVKDDAGQIIGASKIARDVTAQRRHEVEREALLRSEQAARTAAEHANRLRDDFLATVSHELRTPLNAILGWSQLLSMSRSDEEVTEGLDVIERNARIQAQLIEDLLDMSRIISGKVRLKIQALDVADVVDAAIESARPAAQAKSIRINKTIDPAATSLTGDATRLQQVVWNLLSNAIKFTPKGGEVRVALARVDSHLEIAVQDTGVGIKPEYLPVIFDRFRQVDSSTTRNFGGLGLGLAIVKQLVELHGGTVRAQSAGEGLGATFTVQLPIAALSPEAEVAATPEVQQPVAKRTKVDLSGINVLVVDDEPDARMLIARLLRGYDAAVQTANSVDEALEVLNQFHPDVLISDIGMPGKDGYELIRELRSRPTELGGQVPAVALTAFARSEDRMRALLAGYQMHVTKPVESQELLVTVYSLARRGATSKVST